MSRVPRINNAWQWGLKPIKAFIVDSLNPIMQSRPLGPPWASSCSRTRALPPSSLPSLVFPNVSPFIVAPRLSARCPPIKLIGVRSVLSVAGWWVTVVTAIQDQPSGWSGPRFTGRDATVVTEERMSNEWWKTRALTGALIGALSDSYSVTTQELLVNRLGDTVLWFKELNYWLTNGSKILTNGERMIQKA
jgi:hypothetical protein